MVSIREVRRLFKEVLPNRQSTQLAIVEMQERMELLLKEYLRKCQEEAGVNTTARITPNHARLAYLTMMDRANDLGEWNDE